MNFVYVANILFDIFSHRVVCETTQILKFEHHILFWTYAGIIPHVELIQ